MSKSRKKSIYKDRGATTHEYWAPVRHNWKIKLNQNYYNDDLEFKNPKTFMNDYRYSDYSYGFYSRGSVDDYKYENWYHYRGWCSEDLKRLSRK